MDPANPLEALPRGELGRGARSRRRRSCRRSATRTAGRALAGFGSAKGTNEEAYLFQKLVRTGFGSNNVDHCTRLCHASSVAALLEGIGSGAVSNQVNDVAHAEVIFLIGANPTSNHPVAATWIKNAAKRGAKLIYADPRRSELSRHAAYLLQFKPDTDVALLNAMMHTIVHEGLVERGLHQEPHHRLRGAEEERRGLQPRGDGADLRHSRRDHPGSGAALRHVEGLDDPVGHGHLAARARHRQRALPDRAVLMTGQIGRPGTGLHPLRGQNNVQGASDSGLIPMVFPDYQRVDNPEAHARFEKLWGTTLDPKPGLTVVEIMHAVLDGKIRGMYIMGENPAMSDPDAHHAREALAKLD